MPLSKRTIYLEGVSAKNRYWMDTFLLKLAPKSEFSIDINFVFLRRMFDIFRRKTNFTFWIQFASNSFVILMKNFVWVISRITKVMKRFLNCRRIRGYSKRKANIWRGMKVNNLLVCLFVMLDTITLIAPRLSDWN